MADFPTLLEKLGPAGLEELRRLISEELARRPDQRPPLPPAPMRDVPGPDEDLRPRS